RAEYIHRMQQILYEEAMVNVLTYPNIMEAYRTDQIADIQFEPAEGGNIWGQDGYWAWWSAEPADVQAGAGGGLSTGALVGTGAAVLLLVAGGAYLLIRRRATAEDRECPPSPQQPTVRRGAAAEHAGWPCTSWGA